MINILVVDDSKLARKRIVQTIENSNIETNIVGEALNGEDGIKQYIKHRPNLIITDIEMPIMNGIEFTSKIRQLRKDIEIIVVSSIVNEKIKQTVASDELIFFMKKPLDTKLFNLALERTKNNLVNKEG